LHGLGAAYCGLVAAYHLGLPAGPAIVLAAGGLFLVSLVTGRDAGLLNRWLRRRHGRRLKD
ncbi:hypothetical protein J8J21_23035, partial [Mycobacterium tuberculosis]